MVCKFKRVYKELLKLKFIRELNGSRTNAYIPRSKKYNLARENVFAEDPHRPVYCVAS